MKHSRRKPHRVAGGTSPDPTGNGYALVLAGVSALDSKVLVLNKLYVAIRVIPARRAFTLLFNDIAEVIHVDNGQYSNFDFKSWAEIGELYGEFEHERHEWVRTVSYELAVPRVVRLLGYDRLPRRQVKLNRRNLFARDRNLCQYCGRRFPTAELSIDHVTPRSQGGGDTWDNLVCACIRCNAHKGGRTPRQAHLTLIRPPTQPRRNPVISIRLGHEKYQSWKAFLDEAYWSVELG
ncbi:MAG: HNH endonuclease [Planctomycetes bacterium]|nr:HNH endonuclease [Planctomycetota bacterium]MCH7961728.1 HNH endonuclease [Planctomycetota bacterium]MCH9057238.1 HNH endonuclease [Planctomycetota bacterium]